MRLQATDEEVYRMMDRQEHCLAAAGGAAICTLAFLYIFLSVLKRWETLYLLLSAFICTFYFLYREIHLGRHIMEMKNCYMEVTEESMVVRQAVKGGHYESCRIFLDEVEKVVEGSRRGIPEFYVVIREKAEESFFLIDEKEKEGHIFQVKSMGYQPEAFQTFYHKVLWQLPGKVRVIGTKEQKIWGMAKPNPGLILAMGLALGYLLPKIVMWIR